PPLALQFLALLFFCVPCRAPRSPLLPSPTLFRSVDIAVDLAIVHAAHHEVLGFFPVIWSKRDARLVHRAFARIRTTKWNGDIVRGSNGARLGSSHVVAWFGGLVAPQRRDRIANFL